MLIIFFFVVLINILDHYYKILHYILLEYSKLSLWILVFFPSSSSNLPVRGWQTLSFPHWHFCKHICPYVPCEHNNSHLLPVKPDKQKQCPSRESHFPPFWHKHRLIQSRPYVFNGQSIQRRKKNISIHSEYSSHSKHYKYITINSYSHLNKISIY